MDETETTTELLHGIDRCHVHVNDDPAEDCDKIVCQAARVAPAIKSRVEAQRAGIEADLRRAFTALHAALMDIVPAAAEREIQYRFDEALGHSVDMSDGFALHDFGGVVDDINKALQDAGIEGRMLFGSLDHEVPEVSLKMDDPPQLPEWIRLLLGSVLWENGFIRE
jgi:hypothetical protein